jgi:hypothetical protein
LGQHAGQAQLFLHGGSQCVGLLTVSFFSLLIG